MVKFDMPERLFWQVVSNQELANLSLVHTKGGRSSFRAMTEPTAMAIIAGCLQHEHAIFVGEVPQSSEELPQLVGNAFQNQKVLELTIPE